MGQINKSCAVIASAPVDAEVLEQFDGLRGKYVICADGGYDTAKRLGVSIDLLIGDFDSLQSPLPTDVETIRLARRKDDTDVMAALREGIRRGCRDFTLLGVLGGERADHSFANYCALQFLAMQSCRGVAATANSRVFVLTCGRLTLNGLFGCTVSVFPFGAQACCVSYKGMEYPLNHATLRAEMPLGVSNSVVAREAQIILHSGNAIVMVQLLKNMEPKSPSPYNMD